MKVYPRNEQAIAAEREKDKNAENGEDTNVFYNLKKGRTVLRVLPPFGPDGVWYREMREYYFKLDDQHLFLTSPLDFDLTDPLYEYNRSVYEEGNEAAIEEAKRFRPKKRFLLNVLVLSDSSGKTTLADGIKVLKAPQTVKRAFVDLDTDPEYGDITNVHGGFNMIVERTGDGFGTEYTVKAQRERTNLEEILKQAGIAPEDLTLHNLDDIHRKGLKSEDELRALLEQLKGDVDRAVAKATPQPMQFGRSVEVAKDDGTTVEVPDALPAKPLAEAPDLGGLTPPPIGGDN